jgi:carbamoyl-phosphate synthase large subunit
VAALSRVAHLPEWRRLLALPSTGAIATAQDKLETALSLTAANVPVPLTFPYRTATVQDLGNTLGWPVWVRARHGAGSKGAFKAWTANQVRSWVDACALNKGIPEHEFTLSTYLPGPEYGCQLLYWHGHFIVSQTRERVEYLYGYLTPTGQSSSPAVARTVANAGIDHVADQAVRALDHEPHGVYGVDLKCDVNGIPHVTEVNAGRFYTTVDFLAAAGLNLPTMLWKLHNGESVPTLNHSPLAANQYWIRTADCLPRLIRAMDLEKEFAPCRASVPSLSPTH